MSNTQVAKQSETRAMEYVPFGAADKIKLTVAIIRDLVAVPSKSGKLPTEGDCIKFMMMCQAKRLNPFEGDAFLLGYDGHNGAKFSLVTAHQTYLKRAETSVDYDGMLSGVIIEEDGEIREVEGDFHTKEQKILGGWAKVYHKKRQYPTYRRIRLERFSKGYGQWQEDAAGMICKCAEADALRSTFPTMLGGLYMKQEVQEVQTAVVEEAPKFELLKPAPEKPVETRTRRAKPEPAPEPSSQPAGPGAASPAEEPSGTLAQRMTRQLLAQGVVFDDFTDFLVNQGLMRNAKDYPGYDDLPPSVFEALDANDSAIYTKIVKTYGKPV